MMRSMIILALLVCSAVSAMPEENLRELQSEELRQVYRENPAEDLQQLIVSEEGREYMLQQVLFYAGRRAPVDNRAYLFALAVDLYHSLPPGPDPTGYEPGELGGKGDLMRQFQNRLGSDQRGNEQDRDKDWEAFVRSYKNQPDNLAALVEIKYIQYYFQEHIQLDDFIEQARLDAEDLSLSNPTYYAELRAYMLAMRHEIDNGIPPWKENTQSDKPVPAAIGLPVPTAKTAEPVAHLVTPAPEKTSDIPSLIKSAIEALLIMAIAVFVLRYGR